MRGNQAEKGTVLVFVALMLPFLILFAGAAIDIGRAYLHKSYMQNAADAAALAGAEAASGSKARLITLADLPALGQYVVAESSTMADAGADKFLGIDTNGKWKTSESNVNTEYRKQVDPNQNNPIRRKWGGTCYYKVELTDNIDFQFARIFLPDALIPSDWTVNVEAWAKANNLSGLDLDTMMKAVEDAYTFSTFQDMDKSIKKPGAGYSSSERYQYVKDISFTNLGPAYNADGTRSEIFDMDGTNSLNNYMNTLLINFKPDFKSTKLLTDNWDLDKIAGMSVAEARAYLGDVLEMKITNWRILDENGNPVTLPGNLKAESEGGVEWWGRFIDNYLTPVFGADLARALMDARIKSIINVTHPYAVRDVANLPASEISYSVYTDEPNKLDPLFVRIESEEYNETNGSTNGPYVTNTVRDISINIKADNTEKYLNGEYKYRPMIFFYDGPVGENNERGVGRKSRTVTLNLQEDFRGILYAPNSPVHVEGNGHKFYGIIIAQSIVDDGGSIIDTPTVQNSTTNSQIQSFYTQMGFSDAKYDDFGVVKLTVYNNPQKDVVYLTSRAKITT